VKTRYLFINVDVKIYGIEIMVIIIKLNVYLLIKKNVKIVELEIK
jgi:hypothetical protein